MRPMLLPWYIVLIISVPQTFLIAKTGFQLFNLHLSCSRALMLSLIVGVAAVSARELPLPFGFHTIILIIFSVFLAVVITGHNLWHCFIPIATGTLILGMLEGTLLPIFLKITANTTDSLALNPWLNILYFLPLGIIMGSFYFLTKKFNYVIFDLSIDGTDGIAQK
ncbi:hypothetical protein [Desulfoscipio gibsoniae]